MFWSFHRVSVKRTGSFSSVSVSSSSLRFPPGSPIRLTNLFFRLKSIRNEWKIFLKQSNDFDPSETSCIAVESKSLICATKSENEKKIQSFCSCSRISAPFVRSRTSSHIHVGKNFESERDLRMGREGERERNSERVRGFKWSKTVLA